MYSFLLKMTKKRCKKQLTAGLEEMTCQLNAVAEPDKFMGWPGRNR